MKETAMFGILASSMLTATRSGSPRAQSVPRELPRLIAVREDTPFPDRPGRDSSGRREGRGD